VTRLGTLSELDKLGATLELDPEQLAFLSSISPEELRSLRVSIYERLFALNAPVFERLARPAQRMPARIVALFAERGFGPLVAARVVAELPAKAGLVLARKVSLEFFADTTLFLDPRRTRDMIVQMPPQQIAELARKLVRRGEFMTMSRFVDFITEEQTQAALDAIEDEGDLLRVAFYMGSKNRMDHLFRTLPPERVERMIKRVEAEGEELLPAFLSVLIHVSYELKRELAEAIARQPQAVLTGYIRAIEDGGHWQDVLPVVASTSAAAQRAVVNLPMLAEPAVQESIVATVDRTANWALLLGLLRQMDATNREAVAKILAAKGPAALARAADGALLVERWDVLLELAARMPAERRAELVAIIREMIGPHDPELLERIADRGEQFGIAGLGDSDKGHLMSASRSGPSVSSEYS
jgi:hypothetical protein